MRTAKHCVTLMSDAICDNCGREKRGGSLENAKHHGSSIWGGVSLLQVCSYQSGIVHSLLLGRQ